MHREYLGEDVETLVGNRKDFTEEMGVSQVRVERFIGRRGNSPRVAPANKIDENDAVGPNIAGTSRIGFVLGEPVSKTF